MSTPTMSSPTPPAREQMLIGALLRAPAQAIHRRIIDELNAAGFDDLRLPHMQVFQYPGPDGAHPSALAERANVSRQAMNQLLGSLEGAGYVVRTDDPEDGRARLVHLTELGRSAYAKILEILRSIEREWSDVLGADRFVELKELLLDVWESPLVGQSH